MPRPLPRPHSCDWAESSGAPTRAVWFSGGAQTPGTGDQSNVDQSESDLLVFVNMEGE